MNRNIVSGFVENLFWILPLIAIVGLWNYILPIFVVLVISYILYIILDPLVCFIERLIGLRILSIMIVLSEVIKCYLYYIFIDFDAYLDYI